MAEPWLKFYASDWRSDPRLKMCSAGARGVWIEMICLMHEATPYGHLLIYGQPPNEAQLASLTGIPLAELEQYLFELEQMGVFSRTREGVIYSRKLVRMASRSAKMRKNGKQGGNPKLKESNNNPDLLKQQVKAKDKPQKPDTRSQKEEDANASLSLAVDHKPIDEVADAVHAYRSAAEKLGWPIPQQLDQTRRRAISGRIKDAGGVDGWRVAIEKASESEFLGKSRPFSGFGIDWIAKPANFKKIMEGNYDGRSSSRQNNRAAANTDALRDTLDAAGRMRNSSEPNWL